MTSDQQPGDELSYFLYRSSARGNLGDHDIESIVREARDRNRALSLTGCLHHEDGLFFQWLEGPRSSLDAVIALIRKDPRHQDMTDLSYGSLGARQFRDWTMRATNREHGSLMDWFAGQPVTTVDRGAYASSISAFLVAISV